MGNTPATRKLTVDNTNPNNIMHISEDVVNRIKNYQEFSNSSSIVDSHHQSPTAMAVTGNNTEKNAMTQSGTAPAIVPEMRSSIQVEQANLIQLKKNDDYWQQRLNTLDRNYAKITEVIDMEYKKAIMEAERDKALLKPVGETGRGAGDSSSITSYQNAKENVQQCYLANTKESMKCAHVVQEFLHCVDLQHPQHLTNSVS